MMKTHLDQVVEMGSDELNHHYAESVGVWNAYRDHILAIAYTQSSGITKQFPTNSAKRLVRGGRGVCLQAEAPTEEVAEAIEMIRCA